MQEISFSRSQGFFQSQDMDTPIHIIGVGATGSYVLFMLNTFEVKNPIYIWDFDNVEPHNPINQYYFSHQIGMPKVEASKNNATNLNVIVHNEKYIDQELSGYIFLLVDEMEERKRIMSVIQTMSIKGIVETRLGLVTGTVYSFLPYVFNIKKWMSESQYSDDEVEETHDDTCGAKTSILPTVATLAGYATNQFIKLYKWSEYKQGTTPEFKKSFSI